MSKSALLMVLLLAFTWLGVGCASPHGDAGAAGTQAPRTRAWISQGPLAVVTNDGLHQVVIETPGSLFVKTQRPHLYRYAKVQLAPVTLSYKKTSERRRTVHELQLGRHLRDELSRQLDRAAGWETVTQAGPEVLRLELGILAMDLRDPEPTPTSGSTTYLSPSGRVTLVMTLLDSQTDEPLFRFVERGMLPGGMFSDRSTAEIKRVKLVIDRFAEDAHALLEKFHREIEPIRTERTALR